MEKYIIGVFEKELQHNGYNFLTESDTEGPIKRISFLERKYSRKVRRNVFFGIFNFKNKELFCARDRIEKNLLFMLKYPTVLCFHQKYLQFQKTISI